MRPHRPGQRRRLRAFRPMPTTSSTSRSPSPTNGSRTFGPTVAGWPTSWSTTRAATPSSTARPPVSTSRWATTCSPKGIPLGDNHGVWPFLRTYSICKIAAEATALWAADRFGLPTTIARLSVPYGDRGGWPAIHLEMMINGSDIPVHVDAPSIYHPIHEDDIIAMVPGLLGVAGTPATVVNWGGSQAASIEEWCGYLGELSGLTPSLRSDHRDHRQRPDRPDPDARAGRAHHRRLEGRDAPHGRRPASRTAQGLTRVAHGAAPLAARHDGSVIVTGRLVHRRRPEGPTDQALRTAGPGTTRALPLHEDHGAVSRPVTPTTNWAVPG